VAAVAAPADIQVLVVQAVRINIIRGLLLLLAVVVLEAAVQVDVVLEVKLQPVKAVVVLVYTVKDQVVLADKVQVAQAVLTEVLQLVVHLAVAEAQVILVFLELKAVLELSGEMLIQLEHSLQQIQIKLHLQMQKQLYKIY
jgi:hypothetical protein